MSDTIIAKELTTCLERLIDAAVKGGHLEVVKWFYANSTLKCSTAAIDHAANKGHMEIVQWLHATHNQDSKPQDMAKSGDLHTFISLLATNPAISCGDLMELAAEYGHLNIVQWLHDNRRGEDCTYMAMNNAAMGGHLHIVKWLHTNRTEGCGVGAMDLAAAHGHLKTLQWLHKHGKFCSKDAMDMAAAHGHLDIVRFLHENRSEGCTTFAMDWAAENGHLSVFKWLHKNCTEGYTPRAMKMAIQNGHDNVVQWIKKVEKKIGEQRPEIRIISVSLIRFRLKVPREFANRFAGETVAGVLFDWKEDCVSQIQSDPLVWRSGVDNLGCGPIAGDGILCEPELFPRLQAALVEAHNGWQPDKSSDRLFIGKPSIEIDMYQQEQGYKVYYPPEVGKPSQTGDDSLVKRVVGEILEMDGVLPKLVIE